MGIKWDNRYDRALWARKHLTYYLLLKTPGSGLWGRTPHGSGQFLEKVWTESVNDPIILEGGPRWPVGHRNPCRPSHGVESVLECGWQGRDYISFPLGISVWLRVWLLPPEHEPLLLRSKRRAFSLLAWCVWSWWAPDNREPQSRKSLSPSIRTGRKRGAQSQETPVWDHYFSTKLNTYNIWAINHFWYMW